VSFLRSIFLSVIVSLVLLTGYADDLVRDCCAHAEHEQTDHGAAGSADSDDCQCVCHQVISLCTVEPVCVVAVSVKPSGFLRHADEFPPEALPLGIDHPPQLV
jgi:hypothetical protein